MWIRCVKPFSWTLGRHRKVTERYRPDGPAQGLYPVKRACGDYAVANGFAVAAKAPPRPKAEPEAPDAPHPGSE